MSLIWSVKAIRDVKRSQVSVVHEDILEFWYEALDMSVREVHNVVSGCVTFWRRFMYAEKAHRHVVQCHRTERVDFKFGGEAALQESS